MAKKQTPAVVEKASATADDPVTIVAKVLGCGRFEAVLVVERMGSAASQLPAKYDAGDARDWITVHNVSAAKPVAPSFDDDMEAPIG